MTELDYINKNFKGLLKSELLKIATSQNVNETLSIDQYIDQTIIFNGLTKNPYWLGVKMGIQGVETRITRIDYVCRNFKKYEHKDKIIQALISQASENSLCDKSSDKAHFLQASFIWCDTKEGKDFWDNEYKKFLKEL